MSPSYCRFTRNHFEAIMAVIRTEPNLSIICMIDLGNKNKTKK
jgi:hypothetical protein